MVYCGGQIYHFCISEMMHVWWTTKIEKTSMIHTKIPGKILYK